MTQRVWIFQANPTRYRIEESLRLERRELWNLNQHSNEIKKGDTALIWLSGPEAGIYAIGSIKTDPVPQRDSPVGTQYWRRKEHGLRVKARVLVHYKKKMLHRPILRIFLQSDPELWNLSVIRNPRGTNFPVTEAEWAALQQWISS